MRYVALFAITSVILPAAEPLEAAARRILATQCLSCHGATKMAGLDLRDRNAAIAGGQRGPGITPGNAAQSRLYQAVLRNGDLKMPPGKQVLPQAEIDTLKAWIDAGAPWNDQAPVQQQSTWWSFRKPAKPAGKASLDDVAAAKGPAVDRRTLIRRATFDLHGLPPTPAEVEAFVSDKSPGAYAQLIDRLLASPRYGERWGRHWLDVVRYADTGGYETDVYFNNAWRYRDYVIRSFNEDKPYDEFVKEQIAADEIWPGDLELEGDYNLPAHKLKYLERRLGTMLYTLGAFPVENAFHADQFRSEWQAESVETTGAAFLGLTVGCARCHDHKFDPISQRDFFRLSAIFAGSEEREVPIASRIRMYEYTRYQTRQVIVDNLKAQYQALPPGDKDGRETLLRKIGEAYVKAPVMYDKANLLVHTEPVPDTFVLARGDFKQRGEKVGPGVLPALGPAPEIIEPEGNLFIPRRRKVLAEWIASRENPLTARVMVNRIWQHHFGEGIVGSANDFGRQGEPPSDAALLDWLAVEFMDRGWSVKAMHRTIMLSQAYQAKRKPVRLDAEALRDSVLAAAGRLNTKMFGPPVVTPLLGEEREGMRDTSQWPVHPDAAEHNRRSVYLFNKRSYRLPMLETFDSPDTTLSCARRESSTVAPQALALMNSEWMSAQAARFAERLASSADPVTEAWRIVLGRAPSAEERAHAQAYLARNNLARFCLMVFNLSEFLYVD